MEEVNDTDALSLDWPQLCHSVLGFGGHTRTCTEVIVNILAIASGEGRPPAEKMQSLQPLFIHDNATVVPPSQVMSALKWMHAICCSLNRSASLKLRTVDIRRFPSTQPITVQIAI